LAAAPNSNALTSSPLEPTLKEDIFLEAPGSVFYPRAILMVLIALRLLMPPGICACKWSSPAARLLAALLQNQRQVPAEQERDDDDHAPGCPASPLAAGMGVKPPSEPLLPPDLSLDPLPPLQSVQPIAPTDAGEATSLRSDHPQDPLYLTLRALLL
jgi:hypothetical protein